MRSLHAAFGLGRDDSWRYGVITGVENGRGKGTRFLHAAFGLGRDDSWRYGVITGGEIVLRKKERDPSTRPYGLGRDDNVGDTEGKH